MKTNEWYEAKEILVKANKILNKNRKYKNLSKTIAYSIKNKCNRYKSTDWLACRKDHYKCFVKSERELRKMAKQCGDLRERLINNADAVSCIDIIEQRLNQVDLAINRYVEKCYNMK